ncbi:MAG: tetratricopeptide repeat protein, partial [Gemmatimonadota bacterium]
MRRGRAMRLRGRILRTTVVVAAAASSGCVLWPAAGVEAQARNGAGEREIELLREAEARERDGDLRGAEDRFRRVLESRPTALNALLGLERVLRMQGELATVLPFAERLLEEDPESPLGHQIVLRTLSSLNRPEALEEAGEAWIGTTPDVETPYREIARVWRSRGRTDRAIEVLERGRERLGASAFALELGGLYAGSGRVDEAVVEWSRAVGTEAEGLLRVRRRIRALPDGGAAVLPGLTDALTEEPSTLARRRAAAELALDAGLSGRAERIGREVAGELEGRARENFLIEMARGSDAVRLYRVAYWAYGELLDGR